VRVPNFGIVRRLLRKSALPLRAHVAVKSIQWFHVSGEIVT